MDNQGAVEETAKRRKVSSAKQTAESSKAGEETLSASPCLVSFNPGVKISTVAAGGRHTLALSGKFGLSPELKLLLSVAFSFV